jgi:hypothetical protein
MKMNSAKALLDIPDLPEEAFKHIGDRKIRPQGDSGGGGGGGQPANTTSTTTQTSELPEWARGYAKDTLAKGQALTDINQNPYQTYSGDRIAWFSPMQQQAMQNAQGMTAAPQIGQGTAAATGAGLGGFDVAGQANVGGFQNQVGGYMNPYMNQILAPQLAEANRNYDIGATKQQSAATQAGAFGGSREAIMAAENERNRNTGLNQIYGQGLNTAYTNAQNQYNQNLQNQLAGYGMANQAAGQLGQLGQNQYQQNMGINQLQAQYGGQQQALQQQGLTQAYQDFTNQQNYPYKQLGFMSDLIRGLPLGQQSTAAVYQPPPSALQTMGALGLGAYGAKQLGMFAEGGEVKTYAGDKESVTSSGNIEKIIGTLNLQQLHDALQNAQARNDRPTVELIAQQIEKLTAQEQQEASMQNGIAGALPNQMADGIVNAAGGGILAFNGEDEQTGQLIGYSRGDPAYYQKGLSGLYDIAGKIGGFEGESYTPEEQQALTQRYYRNEQNIAGPSPYTDLEADQEQRKSDRLQGLEEGKGAIAFKGIQSLLQGGNAIRGFGNLAGTVGDEAIKMKTADRAEKRAIASMDFNIKKSKRDESLGMYKSAAGSTQKAIEDQRERNKQSLKQLEVQKGAFSDLAKASKEIGRPGAGAGGAGKKDKYAEEYYAQEKAFARMKPTDEGYEQAKIELEAARKAVERLKTSDIGSNKAAAAAATLTGSQNRKLSDHMSNFTNSTAYKKAKRVSEAEADALYDAEQTRKTTELMQGIPTGGASVGGGGGGSNVTRSNF